MASYIIKRGGKAKLDKIDVVTNDFGTPLEVFEQVAPVSYPHLDVYTRQTM